MELNHNSSNKLILILILIFFLLLLSILLFLLLNHILRTRSKLLNPSSLPNPSHSPSDHSSAAEEEEEEELIRFHGAADLAVPDILDAPGEVIGKSSYGTLYEASVLKSSAPEAMVLRFLRPACTVAAAGLEVRAVGDVRHANLVPLTAVYVGPSGEMLLVHPYFDGGNLAQFLRGESIETHKWDSIYKIAHGIAKGLDHLHTGLSRPLIHGNLKSKNILLDQSLSPYISDYGMHLLLNPSAGQEMLMNSSLQGYKAPELMKIKDVSESTDVYSLGVVLLELLTGKEPISGNPSNSQETYLPNVVRSAVLHRRITGLYHPDILMNESSDQRPVTEDRILKLVQLAICCCSPSPSFRPPSKEVLRKIEEIGR